MIRLALLLPALALAACNPDLMNTNPEVRGLEGASQIQTITDLSNQSSATLRPGGRLHVKIESNPTTGYYWTLKTALDEQVLRLVSEDYMADPAPPGIVGSGGRQLFVFEAVGVGRDTIELSYERHADDVAEAHTLRVRVVE